MGTLVSILNVLNDKLRDTTQEAKRRLRSGHRMIMAKTKLKPECYIKDGRPVHYPPHFGGGNRDSLLATQPSAFLGV